MPLICFFGPDGSGKTSIAQRLTAILCRDSKTKNAWLRGTHTRASILARLLRKFRAFQGSDNPYYGLRIPPKLRHLWQLLEFISIIPVWLWRLAVPKFLGYTVISERGLLDFIVWVSITTRDLGFIYSSLSRIALALGLKRCLNIYVRADLEVLKTRRADESAQTTPLQLALYDAIARAVGAPVIDTTGKSVDESLVEALNILKARGSL